MNKLQTLEFYNQNADMFIEQTRHVSMTALYDVFVENLPLHLEIPQHILDVGCGSGRDSFYFSNKLGMNVTAIDGSETLINKTQEHYKLSHIKWRHLRFDEISNTFYKNQFTGIWACASLLHVPFSDLPNLMNDLVSTLITDGVLYASFKYGTEERTNDNGRFFCDMNEARLREVLNQLRINCTVEYDFWITSDLRDERDDEWLNVLINKR